MGVGGALIGSAVIGGITSRKAAKEGRKGQERAAATVAAAGRQAREDVLQQIPAAQEQLLAGARGAFDIFQESIPAQQEQLRAGNLAAQQTAGRGFTQAQQALLGQPVDPFQTATVDFQQNPFQSGAAFLQPGGTEGSILTPPKRDPQLGLVNATGRVPLLLQRLGITPERLAQQIRLGGF